MDVQVIAIYKRCICMNWKIVYVFIINFIAESEKPIHRHHIQTSVIVTMMCTFKHMKKCFWVMEVDFSTSTPPQCQIFSYTAACWMEKALHWWCWCFPLDYHVVCHKRKQQMKAAFLSFTHVRRNI